MFTLIFKIIKQMIQTVRMIKQMIKTAQINATTRIKEKVAQLLKSFDDYLTRMIEQEMTIFKLLNNMKEKRPLLHKFISTLLVLMPTIIVFIIFIIKPSLVIISAAYILFIINSFKILLVSVYFNTEAVIHYLIFSLMKFVATRKFIKIRFYPSKFEFTIETRIFASIDEAFYNLEMFLRDIDARPEEYPYDIYSYIYKEFKRKYENFKHPDEVYVIARCITGMMGTGYEYLFWAFVVSISICVGVILYMLFFEGNGIGSNIKLIKANIRSFINTFRLKKIDFKYDPTFYIVYAIVFNIFYYAIMVMFIYYYMPAFYFFLCLFFSAESG